MCKLACVCVCVLKNYSQRRRGKNLRREKSIRVGGRKEMIKWWTRAWEMHFQKIPTSDQYAENKTLKCSVSYWYLYHIISCQASRNTVKGIGGVEEQTHVVEYEEPIFSRHSKKMNIGMKSSNESRHMPSQVQDRSIPHKQGRWALNPMFVKELWVINNYW